MKSLPFIWHDKIAPKQALDRDIDRLSILSALPHIPPNVVILWHGGLGVRIQSQMSTVAPRFEVGVLTFSMVQSAAEKGLDIPLMFGPPRRISKLVLKEEGVVAESGLVLENASGQQIIIVAAVSPYSVAIRAPGYDGGFDPEYDLECYERVPIV